MHLVRDLPPIERPREKLYRYGPGKLNDEELLAIILGSGRRKQNAIGLAQSILKNSSLEQLADDDVRELVKHVGVGMAKASAIVALFELGRRLYLGKKTQLVLAPRDVWQSLSDISMSKKEHLVVFFLDSRNQIIRKETISMGTVDASIVHPREVFEPAIKYTASQIIIAHNHPSGDHTPSEEDRLVTKRLVEAGRILGIAMVDHIIVTSGSYYSFKENNLV